MSKAIHSQIAAWASVIFIGGSLAASASAQQIGRGGWEPQARSTSLAAQFQFQKKNSGGSGGGMDALTQYVTNYNTSSTSIGNYTEVIQTLGDGANGTVNQNTQQESSGSQTSASDTHDNQTTNDANNATASGKGKGDKTATVVTLPTQAN